MTSPLLSILIPTLKTRREMLGRLLARLAPQLGADVQTIVEEADSYEDGGPTIGARRQAMIERCKTPYLVFVDDDDLVSETYCPQIVKAIKCGADVVGFRMWVYYDGQLEGEAIHRLAAGHWYIDYDQGRRIYWRTPNHLNPIRSDIARDIGYRDLKTGEDGDYSVRLYSKHSATIRETMIEDHLYHYLVRAKPVEPVIAYDKRGKLTREGAAEAIKQGGSAFYGGRMVATMKELEAVHG